MLIAAELTLNERCSRNDWNAPISHPEGTTVRQSKKTRSGPTTHDCFGHNGSKYPDA